MKSWWMMVALLISGISVGPSALAQGGSIGGNGGDAILERGDFDQFLRYRLFDFYQIQLRDPNHQIGRLASVFDLKTDLESLRLKRDLGKAISDLPIQPEYQKSVMGVLGQFDPLLARVLAAPIALYHWERKDKVEFVDDYKSTADYRGHSNDPLFENIWRLQVGVHQVGRRILDRIELSNDVFDRMYDFDQIGLIFHELVYALLVKDPTQPFGQHPEHAREANGALFAAMVKGQPVPDVWNPDRFSFAPALAKARAAMIPGEALKVRFERGKFYRIEGQKFALEFTFVEYRTPLFLTYYVSPKFVQKP